jgi:uncharacterized protein
MHQLCYFEIIANDLPAAQQFYHAVFDGEMIPSGERYVMWNLGAGIEGGLQLEPLARCGPDANRVLVYVEVADIEAKLAEAAALGGTVVKPKTQISAEYGYYGVLRDPQGTLVGLWSKA